MRVILGLALAIIISACDVTGGGPRWASKADSRSVQASPEFLRQYASTRRFSAGNPRSIKVTPDGSAVLFLRSPARSRVHDLYEFDVESGEERVLLTAEKILQGGEEELSVEEKARRERMRLSARGIAVYGLSKDGSRILVPLSGRLFVIERATGSITELASDSGYPIDARFSPDGRFVSCVRGKDVFVIDIESGVERQVTARAGGDVTNGMAEFVAQEEMGRRRGYWWSPDSEMIAFQQNSTEGMEVMHIADAMHPERAPQSWPYPRPGKKNADVRLGLVHREGGPTTWVSWDRNRYPYLATVKWMEGAPLTILVQNRRQTEEVLLAVDADTGGTSELLLERDVAWINLDQSMPKWLSDGSAFLWTTERTGWWRLELRARDGRLIRPLTPDGFPLKGFVHLDEGHGVVCVAANADPTQTHLYRVSLDDRGAVPERLTEEPGVNGAIFSKNGEVYVHTLSTPAGGSSRIVRDRQGRRLGSLRSVAETPPFVAKIELTTVGKKPMLHAVLIRPRDFKRRRKYPVIVSVYGGPHRQTVRASARRYLLQQWIADHGFIVVSIDGRGTPSRGRNWERVIKGNLIAVPLSDQVAGLEALGRKYRELDLDRVGIFGWSFGGYFSAHAIMQRPDVFDVAVAGAPVCDWLDYDTHYTERYMGMPEDNPTGYERSSVLSYCDRLENPLLIIHGTADDNVYFMHSLKMSNALFRAGRDHELLALSDFTHMVAEPEVTMRLYERIVGFLAEHLLER